MMSTRPSHLGEIKESVVRVQEVMAPTSWGCMVKISGKVGYPCFSVPGIQVGHPSIGMFNHRESSW